MAYQFSINNVSNSGAVIMWALEQLLVAAGWTKTQDSDGTTYSPVGARLTHSGAGVNGLNNASAWFVLQAPAIGPCARSFCFQRGVASQAVWRIKYSRNAGFIGGAPGATQTPSAADELVLEGGGTDAAPTFETVMPNGGVAPRVHMVAGQAAENFNFVMWPMTNGATTYVNGLLALCLDVLAPNSFSATDPDPAVIQSQHLGNGLMRDPWMWGGAAYVQGFTNSPVTWQGAGFTYTTASFPGTDPFTGKDALMPMLYAKMDAAPKFYKGISTLFYHASIVRTPMDTFNLVGVRDFVYEHTSNGVNLYNTLAVPWDGSIPII